ncbi:ribonuclease P/MRP protein subunit POP7 [Alternaria panax]|uniref:Ribonuclease P/MRP protein subunit POP7 n=1 Tax=Alternaria panax TaxID=48097 RepID=A0AAD4FD64_9PLEO|nr:ribonuclease P/MRP protein subunit POP7 [Alternaria panax]
MTGIKRSIDGQAKPQNKVQEPEDVAMMDTTPPCGQPQPPSDKATSPDSPPENQKKTSKPKVHTNKPAPAKQPFNSRSTNLKPHQKLPKLPKLPKNTTITTRSLLHASLASPRSSSGSAKTLYITATTAYIPTLKRARKLLNGVVKREKQSANSLHKARGRGRRYAEANGRLEARDVEAEIAGAIGRADGSRENGAKRGEEIYLKATGRAIPRALQLGLHFQSEEDCWVKIEMGSVSAIDDIEVKSWSAGEGEEAEQVVDDVPETRVRMLSSITVSIGLK